MIIDYSRTFIKSFKKCSSGIKNSFAEKILLFSQNKFHPQLSNHALHGKFSMFRSINISGDWRVIFQELSKDKILLVNIGTHSELYK